VSVFRNEIPTLTWENPFRITDAIAVAPQFAVGRNRFVRAQLDLPPNNDFESISIHGGGGLSHQNPIPGEFTLGPGTQYCLLPLSHFNSGPAPPKSPGGRPGSFRALFAAAFPGGFVQ